jgi:dissimilatory sulfite reductase related protein
VPVYEVADRKYEVDEDGFLQEPEKWNAAVAQDFALTEHLDLLTEEHWKIINYIRNYYLQHGIAPMVRKICKENSCPLTEIYNLFPSGPAKGACKLAGLPKPTGCV